MVKLNTLRDHSNLHQPHAGSVEESLLSHVVKFLLDHLLHLAVALYCLFQRLALAPPAPSKHYAEDSAFALSLPKPSTEKIKH